MFVFGNCIEMCVNYFKFCLDCLIFFFFIFVVIEYGIYLYEEIEGIFLIIFSEFI